VSILTIPFNALVSVIPGLGTPRVRVPGDGPSSQSLHVVAREGAEVAGPLAGAHVPSVIALLHHVHRVALLQLQLVVILRLVVVQRPIPVGHGRIMKSVARRVIKSQVPIHFSASDVTKRILFPHRDETCTARPCVGIREIGIDRSDNSDDKDFMRNGGNLRNWFRVRVYVQCLAELRHVQFTSSHTWLKAIQDHRYRYTCMKST